MPHEVALPLVREEARRWTRAVPEVLRLATDLRGAGMSTKIEWTDETWNPTTGCTKVSPGCDHCYAKTMHERFNGPDSFETVTLHPERLDLPLRWRKPRKVFVNSMSDLFHQDIPDDYVAKVFAVMAAAPEHTFQVLTKRHARMRSLLTDTCKCGRGHAPSIHFRSKMSDLVRQVRPGLSGKVYHEAGWPLRNVHMGVSVEDQHWADIRIPALVDTPAAIRFLSCEPLLGPLDLTPWLGHLDWVIVGGESGHGARPMNPDWVRSLRDQCTDAGVAFLFKQWGAWAPDGFRVGKGKAGREIDGRTWDEFPEAVTA